MTKAKEFSTKDRFGKHNGMEVIFTEPGRAIARMEIQQQHLNGIGTTHGGALFTLADLAFAAASNCGEEMVASINAAMSFVKATSSGVLTAEAREIARSSKLVTYEARVTGSDGAVVAVFQGTGYIKKHSG